MKAIQWIISALVAVVIIAAAVGGGVYFTRLKSIHSIRKLTDYENYNLYRMDIDYAYDLDRLIDRGITDNQSMINAILAEALPYLPIHMKAPNFGCSAFCTQGTDGHTLMGRNYDFKNDTSAMLVYCTPKDGYASVAFAALDNINANTPDASMAKKLATLTAPFICLDGMNEKGVSIAVLTLDSDPTYQQTGKPMIATTLAIRLVLDRAATTAEAVELLSKYDMFASSGRDYHFYITDASGDGRVLEYDCNDPARQCIGCMTSRPKKELVRVVRAPSGEISIDLVGKKPGRGAYLCPDPDCLTKAKKKKALERCFEQPVPAEVYDALAAQLAGAAKEAEQNGEA